MRVNGVIVGSQKGDLAHSGGGYYCQIPIDEQSPQNDAETPDLCDWCTLYRQYSSNLRHIIDECIGGFPRADEHLSSLLR